VEVHPARMDPREKGVFARRGSVRGGVGGGGRKCFNPPARAGAGTRQRARADQYPFHEREKRTAMQEISRHDDDRET